MVYNLGQTDVLRMDEVSLHHIVELRKTDPFDHFLRNGMEVLPCALESVSCQLRIHSMHEPEDGSAVLHPSFYHVGSIVTYDPFCCFLRERTSGVRLWVFERKLEEAVSDLDIGCRSKPIYFTEVEDM